MMRFDHIPSGKTGGTLTPLACLNSACSKSRISSYARISETLTNRERMAGSPRSGSKASQCPISAMNGIHWKKHVDVGFEYVFAAVKPYGLRMAGGTGVHQG